MKASLCPGFQISRRYSEHGYSHARRRRCHRVPEVITVRRVDQRMRGEDGTQRIAFAARGLQNPDRPQSISLPPEILIELVERHPS